MNTNNRYITITQLNRYLKSIFDGDNKMFISGESVGAGEIEITKIMFDIICLALVIFAVMILNTGHSLLDVLAIFVGKASQISYGIVS